MKHTPCQSHTQPCALSVTHPLNHTSSQSCTFSVTHPFNHTPSQSCTLSVKHPFNQTPSQPCTFSVTHPLNHTPSQACTLSAIHPLNQKSPQFHTSVLHHLNHTPSTHTPSKYYIFRAQSPAYIICLLHLSLSVLYTPLGWMPYTLSPSHTLLSINSLRHIYHQVIYPLIYATFQSCIL